MEKWVISVLGGDRPGIVAQVASCLAEFGCNIEDCNQTILQTEFAAIFIVTAPEHHTLAALDAHLQQRLQAEGLTVRTKSLARQENASSGGGMPFVVATKGPDRVGMIAALANAMATLGCNINNFRAIARSGDGKGDQMTTIFEITLPVQVELSRLKASLGAVAQRFELEISVQHSAIFAATNQITPDIPRET